MQDCVQLKNDIDVIRKNKDIAIKNKICRINELEKQLKENQDKYASVTTQHPYRKLLVNKV